MKIDPFSPSRFLLSVLPQLFVGVPRRARAGYSRSWSCLLGALGSLLGVLSSLASQVTVLASYGASDRWENAWEQGCAEFCAGWRCSPALPSWLFRAATGSAECDPR